MEKFDPEDVRLFFCLCLGLCWYTFNWVFIDLEFLKAGNYTIVCRQYLQMILF